MGYAALTASDEGLTCDTISSNDTALSVNSRTSSIRSTGTPLVRHCVTAEIETLKCAATSVGRPRSASSHSEKIMLFSLEQPKRIGQVLSKPFLFSILLMGTDVRRAALNFYLDVILKGDRGELQQRGGLSKGRISQLLNGPGPFGERAGESLARRLKLPPDYFERAVSGSNIAGSTLPLDEQRTLLIEWERLTPVQRSSKLDAIQAEAAANIDIAEHLQTINVKRDAPGKKAALSKKNPHNTGKRR